MKIKKDYVLRNVANHHIVIPTGQEGVNFNGVITLNKSGKLLFEKLITGAEKKELVKLLTDTYSVKKSDAEKDVDDFIDVLESKNVLE